MTKLVVVLIAVLAVGCDEDDTFIPPGAGADDVDDDDDMVPAGTLEWRATLTPTADIYNALVGDAVVRQVMGEAAFMASINLRQDAPGAVRPWHVHLGDCAARGPIVGADSAYPRLMVGNGGAAASDVLIRIGLDPSLQYSVNVHESDAQFNNIISCGNLLRQ